MYKINYVTIIKALENSDTKELIGLLDINTIEQDSVESLFYKFPLIERMVLEIYKLLPLSDVEHYQQGTMRTIMQIIKNDSNHYFPDNLIAILEKYYGDKGLRNKLLHVKDDIGTVPIQPSELDNDEIRFVIMQLLSIMRNTYGKYTIDKIGTIDLV